MKIAKKIRNLSGMNLNGFSETLGIHRETLRRVEGIPSQSTHNIPSSLLCAYVDYLLATEDSADALEDFRDVATMLVAAIYSERGKDVDLRRECANLVEDFFEGREI